MNAREMTGTPLPPAVGSSAHSDWLDRFFASYYRHRPVNASFIGVHDYDALLPDFSEGAVGDAVAEMRALLAESAPLEHDDSGRAEVSNADVASGTGGAQAGSAMEALDVRLARGFLETQLWEYGSRHFHGGNPSVYTGEAVFGVMAAFLTDYAPLGERVEAATHRLGAVPGFLAQARTNVRAAPTPWTRRAVRECDGALAFLTDGVDALVSEHRIDAPQLRRAADRAAAAFAQYRAHLDGDLRRTESYACGEEAFSLYLRRGHFLEDSAQEIVRYARAELAEADAALEEGAAELGARGPTEVLTRLTAIHPSAEGYYDRYQRLWDESREVAQAHDLLTWPDFPIRYVPRPQWTRKAAPFLYFLFYRSPAAFCRPPIHDYLVTPLDPSAAPDEQERFLRAHHDGVIKSNHVIHHGGIGHHVQNWNAFRSPSRVGRIAAVDCAARIAMFCGGTMAEGWACYATDLMGEVGALTELERYAEHQARRRMCARTVVDVELHRGRFTLEQAADYYEAAAGMTKNAAESEAVKNSMFPGAAVMYLMGTDAIHDLRRDMEALQGERFTLRGFHDELLSYGSVPVSLVSLAMKRKRRDAN
jgi:hypothetical protein